MYNRMQIANSKIIGTWYLYQNSKTISTSPAYLFRRHIAHEIANNLRHDFDSLHANQQSLQKNNNNENDHLEFRCRHNTGVAE